MTTMVLPHRFLVILLLFFGSVVPSHQQELHPLAQETWDFWTSQGEVIIEDIDDNHPHTLEEAVGFDTILSSNHSSPNSLRTRSLSGAENNGEYTTGGNAEKAIGKLIFTNQDGSKYLSCTATVLKVGASASDRFLLLTAAHCLCDSKTRMWFKNFVFMPMRDFPGAVSRRLSRFKTDECPKSPFGCWLPTVPLVEENYEKNLPSRYFPFDYGILVIPVGTGFHVPPEGTTCLPCAACLECRVGGGMEVEMSSEATLDVIWDWLGYQGDNDPDLRYCAGTLEKVNAFAKGEYLIPNCRMGGGGASGGPLLPHRNGDGKIYSVKSSSGPKPLEKGCFGPLLNHGFPCVYKAAKTIPKFEPKLRVVHPDTCVRSAKVVKDPHFSTWTGHRYDFMGQCDILLLNAPHFAPSLTLDIIIRTKVRYFYSYVENAILKIGNDFLEVGGYGDYSLNGISSAEMPNLIAGLEVTHSQPAANVSIFEVHLGDDESLSISTYKEMVSVKIDNADVSRFRDSRGMFGDYETGQMLARDGITVLDDPNAFGAEWQLRDDEPMLFRTADYPQFPQKCVLPDPDKAAGRRLGDRGVSREAAEVACSKWSGDTMAMEDCIHDVLATGDLGLADEGDF